MEIAEKLEEIKEAKELCKKLNKLLPDYYFEVSGNWDPDNPHISKTRVENSAHMSYLEFDTARTLYNRNLARRVSDELSKRSKPPTD